MTQKQRPFDDQAKKLLDELHIGATDYHLYRASTFLQIFHMGIVGEIESSEGYQTLFASSNTRGRFALDSEDGPELTSGQALDIYLNGKWIPGRVEHMTACYPGQSLTRLFQPDSELGPRVIHGYYFIAPNDLGIVGLCIGMKVRLK